MIVVPLYIIPPNSTDIAIGWIQAGTFVAGMILLLVIVFLVAGLFTPYRQRNEARTKLAQLLKKPIIQIVDKYEEYIPSGHECGLIFKNSSEENIVDCQARLLDLAFETPHEHHTLGYLLRMKNLFCEKTVAGFSEGKLPLFRWGRGSSSKSAEFVYDGGTESVAYGIANTPILLMLNIWAENVPATYAICKLSDRMWGGYDLSILKTGLQKDNPKLDDFQILDSHTEDSLTE
ncbi:hypothetical protein ACFLTY_00825 [Chloroflexota bacterium]